MEKKEEYQISSSVNEGLLEFILSGEILESQINTMIEECNATILASGVKYILMDVRAIKGRYGYVGAYARVRSHPPEFYGRIKVAIVDLPENSDYRNFHETTALNVGLKVKWFTDIDAARAWLKSFTKK